MKALPVQDRALKKRAALIKAAIAEFSGAGFEVATAKSIAARAGVATGTFYQYFENKNDILRVIADERIQHLQQTIDFLNTQAPAEPAEKGSARANFERVLTFIYEFHAEDPELHQVIEQRRYLDPELQAILQAGEAVLCQRVLRFVQSFNVEQPKIVADNLFAMGEGLVHRHVFSDSRTAPKDVVSIGAQMLASYFENLD